MMTTPSQNNTNPINNRTKHNDDNHRNIDNTSKSKDQNYLNISPSTLSFSSNSSNHQPSTNFPNIKQFKASGHILSRSHNSTQHLLNNSSSGSAGVPTLTPQQSHHHHHHHQPKDSTSNSTGNSVQFYQHRTIDPDEEPINVKTFSGIFYSILIFIISFLPLFLIEKLLTLFAWVQLELLKAKGRGISPEQSYSKLKKKRKLLKKKKPQIVLHKPIKHKTASSNNHLLPKSLIKPSASTGSFGSLPSPNLLPVGKVNNDGNITSIAHSSVNHSLLTPTTPTIKLTTIDSAINEDVPLTPSKSSSLEDKPIYELVEEEEEASEKNNASAIVPSASVSPDNEQAKLTPTLSNSSELLKLATNNSIRQRSDSISVLPSMESEILLVPKPISEIRRVNSEATLYNTNEDNLIFEANQQSRKEFEDFLRSVKDIKDVHNWLKNFSGSATKKIAIVKISRRILDTPFGIESAASSLAFMYKFGLYPIVVHGGLNDISKLPLSQVIKERRMRSSLLKEAIKKNGVGSTVLTPDICEIEPYIMDDLTNLNNSTKSPNGDNESLCSSSSSSSLSDGDSDSDFDDILPSGGLTMKIDSFDYDLIIKALDKGKIPIWDSVAETVDGVDIPINSDITTFELAKRLQPYKIIFACNDGGILDSDHKAIPVVYLDQDYKHLMESEHITDRRRVQLKQMKRIVDNLNPTTAVVVTSIETITHQLLFPRLANGTIIKKSEDNKVIMYDSSSFLTLDLDKLRILIEDSFGRPLSSDYFDYLKETLHKLYLCINSKGEYNGCAIVTFKHPDYIPYLCKFCVRKSAQGLGLGDLIWRVLQRDNDKLYWRSRNNNPLNPWYFQRCQGSFRADESFTIFWYGDDKFEDGSQMIECALNKPITVLPISSN